MKLARCLRSGGAPGSSLGHSRSASTHSLAFSSALPSTTSRRRHTISPVQQARRTFAAQRRRKTNDLVRKDIKPEYFVENRDKFQFDRASVESRPKPSEFPLDALDFENDAKFAPPEDAPEKTPVEFRRLPPVIEIEDDAADVAPEFSREALLKWKPGDKSPLADRSAAALKALDPLTRARLGPMVNPPQRIANPEQFKMCLDEVVTNNPRRPYHKQPSARHLLRMINDDLTSKVQAERPLPSFRSGHEIDVTMRKSLKSDETYVTRGMVIARHNNGYSSTFTLRSMADNEAYEQVLPVYSPWITAIKVVGRHPVKKSRLFYMRKWPEAYTTGDLLKKLNYRSQAQLDQATDMHKRVRQLKRKRRLQTVKRHATKAAKKAAKKPTIGGPSPDRISDGL